MLKIAGIQLNIEWEKPEENLLRCGELLKQAAAQGAELLVLPEMFATGFSMRAEAMAAYGPHVQAWLSTQAQCLERWILAGLAWPGEGRPENQLILLDPRGEVQLRYNKMHPFSLAKEQLHFQSGSQLNRFELKGLRICPLICYDLRFPEPFRLMAPQTDLFILIASWPKVRRRHWSTLLQARAIENQAFLLGVNRVGRDDRLEYSGDSALIDPLGELRSSVSAQEGIVSGVLERREVERVRERFSFLADKRDELYTHLQTLGPGEIKLL